MIHYNMGLLDVAEGDNNDGLKHLYRASDILADADMLDTELGDAVEDAIVASGGHTLARVTHASRDRYEDEYDEDEDEYEREDERWEPGETWREYGDQLDYPPDELYGESTLPPQ